MRTRMMVVAIVMAFVLGLASVPAAAAPVLLSHYRFDESTTDSESGADGTVKSGTWNGTSGSAPTTDSVVGIPTYIDGPSGFGKAIEFQASGSTYQYLDATKGGYPNNHDLDDTGSLTTSLQEGGVSFWVKTSNQNSFCVTGVANLVTPANPTAFVVQANRSEDNDLFVFVRDIDSDGGGADVSGQLRAIASGVPEWQDDAWHHIAITWNAASSTPGDASMWLDGTPLTVNDDGNSVVDTTPTYLEHDYSVLIGAHNNRDELYGPMGGALDDYRVYSGRLAQSDVNAIRSSAISTGPTLVSHYTFESCDGTTHETPNSVAGAPAATSRVYDGTDNDDDGGDPPGAPTGIVAGPTGFGNAVAFDGATHYLDLTKTGGPHTTAPLLLEKGGIAFWFKTAADNQDLFMFTSSVNGLDGGPADSTLFNLGSYRETDRITFLLRDVNGKRLGVETTGLTRADFADDEWHHFALTWNGDGTGTGTDEGDSAMLWLDGTQLDIEGRTSPLSDWGEVQNFNAWDRPFYLGGHNNRGELALEFDGAIDDYRVYAGMLSQSDVDAMMTLSSGLISEPGGVAVLGLALLGLKRRTRS
jgi:hypothetical protein